MKTITKFIYAAFALAIVAMSAVTANGALGDLFVTINGGNQGDGFIYQYAPSGGSPNMIPFGNYVRGLAFDNLGDLFVANNSYDVTLDSGEVFKIAPDGTQSIFTMLSPNFGIEGLATDTANNVFAVARDSGSPTFATTIFKITAGGIQSTFGSLPSDGWGAAFDGADNLFVADGSDQTIYKFTPDGTRSIFLGPSAFDPLSAPIGLAFDRFGNLFVSTSSNFQEPDAILKFTPTGVESTFATGVTNPRGLAFDRSGNLFVTLLVEGGPNGEILKFTPDGTMTVFASGIAPCLHGSNCGPEWLAIQLRPSPRTRPTPAPRPTPHIN